MIVPIEDVRENGHNVRVLGAGQDADAQLLASIRDRGVLVPLLVRAAPAGGHGMIVIDGHRRRRAAIELGLTHLPVELREMEDADATAAQAAVNMVRAAMQPLDEWRAVVRLQEQGYSLSMAGAALGLSERYTRMLDRLGRLHPSVVALIEAAGMPDDRELRTIANADPKAQAKAVKNEKPGEGQVRWWAISDALRVVRIPRSRAIFDVERSKLRWDEDLFAEPGSDDQFTTIEVKRFLDLQRGALETQVAEAQAKKKRVSICVTGDYGDMTLPKGFHQTYGNPDKPRKTETVFMGIGKHGEVVRVLAEDVKAVKAAEREKAHAVAAVSDGPVADEDGSHEAPAAAEAVASDRTARAREMISVAKTVALRKHLRETSSGFDVERAAYWLLLALTADNVHVFGESSRFKHTIMADLRGRIVNAAGQIEDVGDERLHDLICEALARVLVFPHPAGHFHSGDVAEWIGAEIGAVASLPRFDTPEFLATLQGEELRRIAGEHGIKAAGGVADLRRRMEGQLPDWRPTTFGAPGLVVFDDVATDDDVAEAAA